MAEPAERFAALVARATHPTTPPEEARTAALIACQYFAAHSLEIVPAGASAAPTPPVATTRRRVDIVARYRGWCGECRNAYRPGTTITRTDRGWAHVECAE